MDKLGLRNVVSHFVGKKADDVLINSLIAVLENPDQGMGKVVRTCLDIESSRAVADILKVVLRVNPAEADVFSRMLLETMDLSTTPTVFCLGTTLALFEFAVTEDASNTDFEREFPDFVVDMILAGHRMVSVASDLEGQITNAVYSYATVQGPDRTNELQYIIDKVDLVVKKEKVITNQLGKLILNKLMYQRFKYISTTDRLSCLAKRPQLFCYLIQGGVVGVVHVSDVQARESLKEQAPTKFEGLWSMDKEVVGRELRLGFCIDIKA